MAPGASNQSFRNSVMSKLSISIRTAGTLVMACFLFFVTVTLGSLLVITMKGNVESMVDASNDMADDFARMFLFARTHNLEEQITGHLTQPVIHAVMVGISQFRIHNLDIDSLSNSLIACRACHTIAGQEELGFITEINYVNFQNADPLHPKTKIGIRMLVNRNDDKKPIEVGLYNFNKSEILWYTDRVPSPEPQDFISKEPFNGSDMIRNHVTDNNKYSNSWSRPRVVDGVLRMSYAMAVRPDLHPYDTAWIVTDFSLSFTRGLLQTLAFSPGEPSSPLAFDDPNYVPKLDENILCIVERDTDYLIECSHGFVVEPNSNGSWSRIKGHESAHPVIGPIFQKLQREQRRGEAVLYKYSSAGTSKYPIPLQSYFVEEITMAVHEEHDATMHIWTGVAIIPRSSLLTVFDESTRNVKESNSRAIVVAIVVAGSIIVLGVAATFAYETALRAPLLRLVNDMHDVENMNIENLGEAYREHTTIFSEINGVKESFVKMIDMLLEYKAFMPSYLVGKEGSVVEDSDMNKSDRLSAPSISSTSSQTSVAVCKSVFVLDLSKQVCSFLTVSLAFDLTDVSFSYNSFLSTLTANNQKLQMHIIVGAAFIQVVFNASVKLVGFSDRGLACAVSIKNEDFKFVKGISYEVNEVEAGNVGCNYQKWFLVRAGKVIESRALSQYAAFRKCNYIVCNENVTTPRYSGHSYYYAAIDVLQLGENKIQTIFRLAGERKMHEEEWMYSLEADERSALSKLNKAFSCIVSGEIDNAKMLLTECRQNDRKLSNIEALISSVESGKVVGVSYPFIDQIHSY